MARHRSSTFEGSDIALLQGNQNEIALTTGEVAAALRISKTWLEVLRGRGGGPAFVRLGPGIVRYRPADILLWVSRCVHSSTAEYESYRKGNSTGRRGKSSTKGR